MQASSELREILREYARQRPDEKQTEEEWPHWILAEGRRRTVCCIYNILDMISTTYDVPSLLFVSEIDVQLPSSTAEVSLLDPLSRPCDFVLTYDRFLSGQHLPRTVGHLQGNTL